jgi:hypothetical protein
MYFKRKIFLLDKKQVREITGKPRTAAVFKMLEEMNDVKALCPAISSPRTYENAVAKPAGKRCALDQTEERYITADDCTNLRIELELYPDSGDFINRL